MSIRSRRFGALGSAAILVPASLCASLLVACVADPAGGLPQYGYGGSNASGQGGGTGSSHAATTGAATSGGSGGSTPTLGALAMSLDVTAPDLDLQDRVDLRVSIDPKGYVGQLTLSVDDLSSKGVKTTLASPTVTLDGATLVKVGLTLETASSTPPASVPFAVTGAAGGDTKVVSGTVTVHSAITIHIPMNVDGMAGTTANPNKAAFGDYPTMITAPAGISTQTPVAVRFYNDDDVGHEIHAGQAAQGFPHGNGNIPPHSMDPIVRNVNATGTYDYYLHDENAAVNVGRIVIQ